MEKVGDECSYTADALRGFSSVGLRPVFERMMSEHQRLLEGLVTRALVSAGYPPTPEGAKKATVLGRIEIQHRDKPYVGPYDVVMLDGEVFEGKVVYMGQLMKLEDLPGRAW